jgi:hypothetical protein
MNIETTITDEKARDFIRHDGQEITPEHDAWITKQIEATMAEKKAGKLTYRSLDDVMADFGFNAR